MKKLWKKVRRASPSKSGESSPKSGSTRGSVASLNIGYDVKEKDLTKLHKAAWTGNLNKVKQLARKDPSPLDKENRTPLHLACVQGNEHVVQELLEWKAKVNIGDNQSRTPLMRAVEFGQEGCVALLLAYRVDVDTKDSLGNTALHLAVETGNLSIISMLLKAGASRDSRNKEGLAALHLAVRHKLEDVCRLLLKERANVDVEDINLRTPLMHACQDGSINLVKLLLEFNANTQHKDSKNWSADDCAVIQGHHACSQLIADHTSQRGRASTASTPRSGSWQPSSVLSSPRGHDSMGLPAQDGAGDDSDNETNSRASGAPGSDSWADSSQADEIADKPKVREKKRYKLNAEGLDEKDGYRS
ncbi:pote ankyrin domain family member b [Plakobranchus ocellatus]|uniref:Pote ankyrin domain family member b n=1 Tax=Plakobranchus ocellatus TaxID=259542 RepID=A0AAV3Y4D6_9GAST|nr:pote ankyrin domain family member b [Plakobranchus ocellatus]